MRPVVGVAVGCALPTAWTLARHGHDLRYAWVFAALIGAAGLAFAVDDDAAVLLAASPTPLLIRRAARVVAAAGPVVVAWLAVIALSAIADRLDVLGIEALTTVGVALAVAGSARRAGNTGTGLSGLVAGVVAMLLVTGFSMRYPALPRLGEAHPHLRWLWLAAAAWATALWSARDEAR
jgi:hypothetical protein